MRTTLTLDDDVAALLERARKIKGESIKGVVNEALRRSLTNMIQPEDPRQNEPYQTSSVDLGRCLLSNLDNVSEAMALAEGEHFR